MLRLASAILNGSVAFERWIVLLSVLLHVLLLFCVLL